VTDIDVDPIAAGTAERMLRAVIERIPVGVIIVDASGNVVFVNEMGRRISGELPREHAPVAEQAGDYAIRDPHTRQELSPAETPIGRAVAGEVVEDFESIFVPPGETEERWVRVSATPLRLEDGTIEGAVAIFADVTEERAVEQRRVNFLAAAMHDLKTPLTAIKGYTQILQRQLARNGALTPEAAGRSLNQIDTTVTRMSGLISELLDVTRLRMGERITLTRGTMDLVTLVRRVTDRYRELAPDHEFELQATETVVGNWDEARLERVLDNLMSNAVKYSDEGTCISVTVDQDGDAAVVVVRDQGVGIPEQDLPRIFERFFRGSNAADEAGLGVGLSGVRQLIEQHQGTVAVNSAVGEGTEFTIRLPLA